MRPSGDAIDYTTKPASRSNKRIHSQVAGQAGIKSRRPVPSTYPAILGLALHLDSAPQPPGDFGRRTFVQVHRMHNEDALEDPSLTNVHRRSAIL